MADLTNPATYSRVSQILKSKGHSDSEIQKELGKRVAFQQAPQAVSEGYITKEAALEAVGGLGTPGALDLFQGIEEPISEVQQEAQVKARTLASDVDLLEQNRREVSPLLRGIGQPVKEKFRFLDKGDVDAFEGLQGQIAYTMADAIAKQEGRGVSDRDVQIFKDALPSLGDNEKGAKKKIVNTANQLVTRLVGAGMSEQDAENFKNTFLSELGLLTNEQKLEGQSYASEEVPEQIQNLIDSGDIEPTGDISSEAVQQATEGKTLQGLGENAIKDVQAMVEGTLNLPEVAMQMGREMSDQPASTAILGPIAGTETGRKMISGIIDEYKQLVTHPIEKAYGHPVNTILDVIPLIQGVKHLSKSRLANVGGAADDITQVGKIAETAEIPLETKVATQALDETSDVTRIAGKADEAGNIARTGMLPSRGEIAAKTYSSAFIVPTKRAKNLKPIQTAGEMLDYGVVGGFDDIKSATSAVTGNNGALTKVTRNAIGAIEGEVSAGNLIADTNATLNTVIELTDRERRGILKNIVKSQPTGKEIGKMNPLDAFDHARKLEKLGHQYLNTNTYLTGNVKNLGIGQAYLNAADEIMSQLELALGDQNILANYKTAETIAELEKISPKLAQEFIDAKTISDVRSIQAPFVRANMMIDLTEQAANTAFQSMGRQVGSGIFRSALGGVPGFAAGGPIGGVLGIAGGQIIGPPIEAVIEALRPSVLTKTAQFIKG